jgi:hypothetical protein
MQSRGKCKLNARYMNSLLGGAPRGAWLCRKPSQQSVCRQGYGWGFLDSLPLTHIVCHHARGTILAHSALKRWQQGKTTQPRSTAGLCVSSAYFSLEPVHVSCAARRERVACEGASQVACGQRPREVRPGAAPSEEPGAARAGPHAQVCRSIPRRAAPETAAPICRQSGG